MAPRPDDPDDGVPPTGADVPPSSSGEPPEPPDHGAPPPPTDDEVWAAIVADLAELDGSAPSPKPVDPSTTDAPATGLSFPVAPWLADRRVVRPAEEQSTRPELSGRDWDGTSQIDDAEASVDADEHFVPPDPGPVLGGDPLLTMAWCAAAGVPIFLLVVLVAWRDAPVVLVQVAAALFVIGVGVLVWRMPHRRDPDDDDTGAVV
ncbi:hypothetical protein [Cellulomonas fengjieae]|uniref:Uncharacterized protein n=1 Tax=Cellulomonas fengjieae TaxID=2819978 RepID=A0ABS3SEJ3_9CELL|nr:hypothetical protein [Cellulomonas fengjieae]MBO3084175.1 hypothetical protein [Cellulomonas fengjieae]MBO3103605.1 hypothetical protein [Cellulomonas fengjieae]QVI64578.1 hypothetical protein KG102_10275 [Cellulomonas fengjieae]